ncbi:MAG: histidine kinase [Clostridia bacterium]|nr:histidine kinase [Clostridia bacterium]
MKKVLEKMRTLIRNMRSKNIIRKKLVLFFSITFVLVNSISLYTYNCTHVLTNKINQIFSSDIALTRLSESVNDVEASLKAYLTTSHSEDLLTYLSKSNELHDLLDKLDTRLTDDEGDLLLTDIKGMIVTYLAETDAAEYEKRGRDINGYSSDFNYASQLFDYINGYISQLKIYEFQVNNENYLQLNNRLGVLQTFNMLVILIAMGVNIILIALFSFNITEPIIRLSRAAGEIAQGNYDIPDVDVRSNDEVMVLAQSFNRMADSIRRQLIEIRQNAEVESRLQEQQMQNLKMRSMLGEAQLRALQAQINPHFMFNTLNAGMQLALFEGAERTQAFMERLSQSLRYNLVDIDSPSTLRLEIDNIDNYVYLLKERFADRITYRKELDGCLPDVQMPRMILQPIVENSFAHGIGLRENGGIITLSSALDGETVCVTVADNGCGIQREIINDLLAMRAGDAAPVADQDVPSTGHSIGLRNVVGRLMLFYHAETPTDVIEMESRENDGTRITVRLPLKGPEDTNE